MEEDRFIGRTLGDAYVVEERLGAGGVGAVYAARHRRTGRRYAVKVLLPETEERPNAYRRFQREAEAVSSLGHAGIVKVHDFHRMDDGTPYIVMDLLSGEDVAKRLSRTGPMRWDDARELVLQVADALAAAHALGILHRDLKPANVFLASEPGAPERAVLLDFGLATAAGAASDMTKLTGEGHVLGTPAYMSPEQARGRELDARTDVFSLAVVLYELLVGAPPWDGDSPTEVLARVLTEPHPPIAGRAPHPLPPGLPALLDRALHKDRFQRPVGVEAFAAELRALGSPRRAVLPHTAATPVAVIAARTPGSAPALPPTAVTPLSGPTPRSSGGLGGALAAGVAIGAIVLVLGGVGVGAWLLSAGPEVVTDVARAPDPPRPRPRAAEPIAPPPTEVRAPVSPRVVEEPSEPTPEPVAERPTRASRSPRERPRAPAPEPPPVEAPAPPVGQPAAPAAALAPGQPPGMPDYLFRASEHRQYGRFAECVREAQSGPATIPALNYRWTCARGAGDRAEMQRVCDTVRQRYAGHALENMVCNPALMP